MALVSEEDSLEHRVNLLEMLTRDISLGAEVLVKDDNQGGEDAEESTEAQDDKVSNTFR